MSRAHGSPGAGARLSGNSPTRRRGVTRIAPLRGARHDACVDHPVDKRRHPRGTVAVASIVSPSRPGPVMGVIDLSEGGTCLEWTLPEAPPGTPVRLCFLLGDDQALEIDGIVARVVNGRAGIEFLPDQHGIVQQLLAEVRSDE